MKRPNIVFILTDDHASHAVGAYGSVVNETPHIDRIGNEGRVLANCFCTNALCSPSRASILTGTYGHINGVTTLETPMDALQTTFISQLKGAGYRTAIVGKWHLGEGPGHDPENFDYWAVLRGQGEYFNPTFLTADGESTVEGYVTDIITDLALNWVNDQPQDQPWCLLIHHKAPHRSWEPDEAHRDLYTKSAIPVPPTFDDDYATRSNAAKRAVMRVAEDLNLRDLKVMPPAHLHGDALARWKYQRYMEDYLACVASVDDNVGRINTWLEESGNYEDTLVVYTSDQGFFLGDHGWFDKRFMYDESIRMPFLIRHPSQIPAADEPMTQMVTNVDIAQTLLDAAGVPAAARMQGSSFWPHLTEDPEAKTTDAIYYRYWENDDAQHRVIAHYGIRTERYKLIYFYGDGMGLPGTSGRSFPPEWEFYDLHEDPEELVNVYYDPEYRDVISDLEVRLWQLQHQFGDEPHFTQPKPEALLPG